jgi:hypothetical protein
MTPARMQLHSSAAASRPLAAAIGLTLALALAAVLVAAPVTVSAAAAAAAFAPKSERQPILDMFNRFFLKARSHEDQQQKELVREGMIHRLRDLGFEHSFLQKSRFELKKMPALSYNIISILPGKHRQTKDEKIVLVGAHWDSATKAPVSVVADCDYSVS